MWLRSSLTALPFVAALLLIHHATRLSWGGSGDLPDGSRYKVGPSVVVHVLTPNQTVSETVVCATDHRSTTPPGCAVAPGGERAERLVHAAWHALGIGAMLAGFAMLLSLAPVRFRRWLWIPAIGIVGILDWTVWVMQTQPPLAFAALQGNGYGIGGTLALMEVAFVILLVTGAAVHAAVPPTPERLGKEVGTLFVLACFALLAFRFLDWPPVLFVLGPVAFAAHSFLSRRLGTSPGVDRASERL